MFVRFIYLFYRTFASSVRPRVVITKLGSKRLEMTIEAGPKSATRQVIFGEDEDDVAIKNTIDGRKAKVSNIKYISTENS